METSSRRDRWWFSDGVWLDQGPTGAVIGFVFTHWLADRGVRPPDGASFDEKFARELFAAARRQSGQPEEEGDGSYGGFLWAAAQVLESRRLVDATYECVDTVELALLERGPVIAGISWLESMDVPREVGGRMVCRAIPDSTVRGGHAVLLNGIALDEEIDGVRGFVRFKNSWGKAWGDAGQALIPLEDLGRILSGEVYLPIPARALLGPDGSQEVAIPESGPEVVRYEQEGIGSDLWTTHDTVGYGPYADAIARGIQHPETAPPLTIGIKAPWGAGKTSLMRMIQQRLEWPLRDAPEDKPLRRIRLIAPTVDLRARVTNGLLLQRLGTGRAYPKKIKAAPKPERVEQAAVAEDERRWRPTVWFNPWMYQTGEQVWAGLAHAIIEQTTSRMSPLQREHFWLELNLRRVDEQAVRRKIYGLILERVLPAAIGLLATFVLGLLLLFVGGLDWIGAGLAGASPLALVAVVAAEARVVLGARVGGSLLTLVGPHGGAATLAREELRGSFDSVVRTPDYVGRTGFLYLVHTDMQRVLELVATPDRPLVVFVDDLDRCSPATVVQVIEAINLFLAGELKNTIFVVAMEPEMVAAHIEAAYADLVAKVRERSGPNGDAGELGWRFLEKFVQLPLTMPGIEPEWLTAFFESLFPADRSQDAEEEPEKPSEAEIRAAEAQLEAGSSSLGEVIGSATPPPAAASAAEREALRRYVDRRLFRDSAEITAVVDYATGYLDPPNPREIKRFVNLFRFFVMIHTERILAGLPTAGSLEQVAKIALASTRWPSLMAAFAEETSPATRATVFELLERPPQTKPRKGESHARAALRGLKQELGGCGLPDSVVQRLLAEDVRKFMASDPVVGETARAYL